MEVDFNPSRNTNVGAGQPVNRRTAVKPADNTMSFDQTQSLEQGLKSIPQVRPEKVASGAETIVRSGRGLLGAPASSTS